MARKTRQHPRVRAKNLVAALETGEDRINGCVIENISLGGALVRTGARLPDGTTLQLDILGPGMRKAIRMKACVVGVESSPPGIRFQFLPGREEVQRLVELLQSLGLKNAGATLAKVTTEIPVVPDLEEEAPTVVAPSHLKTVPLPEPGAGAGGSLLDFRPPSIAPVTAPAARAGGTPVPVSKTPPPAAPGPGSQDAVINRLMVQVKGLLLELSDAQSTVSSQQARIAELEAKLEQANRSLQDAQGKLARLTGR